MNNQFIINNVYNTDCIESMKKLSDESIDLVIADPPYFRIVKEKWDYQWKTEEDYLKWSLTWIKEVSRILRKGGSFYCFGYFRTLALLVPHIKDMGLELKQQIIIDKGIRSISGKATKKYKMFPVATESILFIVKDNKNFVKTFLKKRAQELNLTSKQINDALGVKSNGGGMWSIYTGNNICSQFPTKDMWIKLSKILDFNIDYENISQIYNPQMGYTDVWRDIDFYSEKRFHPTQKPVELIKRLICASSNENNIVLDPFVGCGSTLLAAIGLNRKWIEFEINPDYFNITKKRINMLLKNNLIID